MPSTQLPTPRRISVVVTTYNQDQYLPATLQSVLDQTLAPDEIIVVDDESTDSTPSLLGSYGKRLTVIRQVNQGVAAARNTGIARASGTLVALLDGDDIWLPNHLESLWAAHIAHPEAGLLATDVECFSEAPHMATMPAPAPLWTRFGHRLESGSFSADLLEELIAENWICSTSQVAIPGAVLREVGPSDTTLPVSSDYDLYLRIAGRHPIALVRGTLTRWRQHDSSASGRGRRRGVNWQTDNAIVLHNHLNDPLFERVGVVLRREYRCLLASALWRTYDDAAVNGRLWSTRRLMTVARRCVSLKSLLFAAAIWTPKWLLRLGSGVRPLRRADGS